MSVINARNRGILTGIFSGLLGRSLALLAPFIVMPAMLKHLGDANFGIWITAVSITSMAMFTDLGIGNGLLTKLSTAWGANDQKSIRAYIASAYVVLALVAVTLLFALFLFWLALSSGLLTKIGWVVSKEAASILVATLAIFILNVPAAIIQRILYACQRAWIANVWQTIAALASVIICLQAIHADVLAWVVVLAYSMPPVVFSVGLAIWFFSRNPVFKPTVKDYSRQYAVDLLKTGFKFLSLSVVTALALNVDTLIIANFLGAAEVTEYSIPSRLAALLGMIITMVFLPLWPANGEAIAKGDFVWVRRSLLRTSLMGGSAVFLAGILLVTMSGHLIEWWMGRTFHYQMINIALLSLFFVFMAFGSPSQMLLNSVGRIKEQIYLWAAYLVLSVALKCAFVGKEGIWIIPLISCALYLLIVVPGVVLIARNSVNVLERQRVQNH